MTNRREEIMRSLTPRQRRIIEDYDAFHKEMVADPDKTRNWETVLLLLEEYFYMLKQLGLPVESEVQELKKNWDKNIIKGNKQLASEFEEILRRLIALR